MDKITIAIDGHSSCGKSTMAKDLAREIGYVYIDTGAMYRAVTLFCLQNGLIKDENIDTDELRKRMNDISITFQLNPISGKPDTYLNGVCVEDRIRTMDVSSKVSYIAALDFVREAMVSLRSVDDFPCDQMASHFFSGGGHKNASGGKLQCPMDEAVERVKSAIEFYADLLK